MYRLNAICFIDAPEVPEPFFLGEAGAKCTASAATTAKTIVLSTDHFFASSSLCTLYNGNNELNLLYCKCLNKNVFTS